MVQQVGVLIREARSGSCPTAEQIADSLDQQSVCQSRIGSNAPTVRTQVKASISYQAGSLLAMTQRRPSSAIDSAIPTSTVCQFSTLVSGQGPLGPAHLQLPVGDVDTPVSLRPVRASQRLAACSLQHGPESAACSYTQASTSLPGPSSTSNTHHHPHSHTSSLCSLSHCVIQVKQSALHKTSLPQAALQAIPQLGRRPVVLVVDDVAVNRMVLSRMLTQLGYDVLTASDGDECLRICAASRGAIACVLLDLHMPRLDGWQTALAWRQHERGEHSPAASQAPHTPAHPSLSPQAPTLPTSPVSFLSSRHPMPECCPSSAVPAIPRNGSSSQQQQPPLPLIACTHVDIPYQTCTRTTCPGGCSCSSSSSSSSGSCITPGHPAGHQHALACGINEVLCKPPPLEMLRSVLARYVPGAASVSQSHSEVLHTKPTYPTASTASYTASTASAALTVALPNLIRSSGAAYGAASQAGVQHQLGNHARSHGHGAVPASLCASHAAPSEQASRLWSSANQGMMFRGKTHGSVEAGPGLSMGLSSGKHPRDDGSDDGIDDEAGKDMHSWTTAGGSHNLQSFHNSHRQRSLQFSASLPAAASSSGSSMRRVCSTQDASACGAGM